MAEGILFTPQAYQQLLDRLSDLEQRYGDSIPGKHSKYQGKFVRAAITVQDSGGYPTDSDEEQAYPINLGKLEYTPDDNYGAVTDTFTAYNGAETRYGHSMVGFIPEGTVCIIFRIHRQYWIMPAYPLNYVSKIKFKALGNMANDRTMNVEILEIMGTAVNPTTGDLMSIGDTLDVHDTNLRWTEAQTDAIGTAYYVRERDDVEDYWAIETCSLPINYVTGYIEECIYAGDETEITVVVHCDSDLNAVADGSEEEYRLSTAPETDIPAEWTLDGDSGSDGAYRYLITCDNPKGLDAVATDGTNNYRVWLQRKVDKPATDPDTNAPDGDAVTHSGTVTWEITGVEKQIARRIEGTVSGTDASTATITRYYEGEDPSNCDEVPTVEWACAPPCELKSGTCFHGFYDPEANVYQIVYDIGGLLWDATYVTNVEWDAENYRIKATRKAAKVICEPTAAAEAYIQFYDCFDEGSESV